MILSFFGCSATGLKVADISCGLTPENLADVPLPDLASPHSSRTDSLQLTPQFESAAVRTIQSFTPDVHCLHTRTRPKKIGMTGSDGKSYTFLLKVSTLTMIRSALKAHIQPIPYWSPPPMIVLLRFPCIAVCSSELYLSSF